MEKDRIFKIKDVEFTCEKILPIRGWEICELFREAVGRPELLTQVMTTTVKDAKGDVKSKAEQIGKRLMAAILLGVSRAHVLAIRNALFEFVKFKLPDQPKPMDLQGLEEMAFESIGPLAVYEVLGRCFYVNFTEYFVEMMDRLGMDVSTMAEDADSDTSP